MAVVQSVSTWKPPYHLLTFSSPGGRAPGDTSFILRRLAEQSTGPAADQPCDLTVRERAAEREHSQDRLGIRGAFGPAAPVETDLALQALLMSMRSQVFSLHAFTGLGLGLGLMPGDKRLIIVQGMQHLHEAFAPLASEVLYVSTLGALDFNFAHLPCRVRDVNYWPGRLEPHGLG